MIAISVAGFIISLAGSSWRWQTSGSTVTCKQSLSVNDLIFALALQIEVESHRANQLTSVLKYLYMLEYNYLQINQKWQWSERDLQIHSTSLYLWQMCNDRDFIPRKTITVFSELVTHEMEGAIDYLCI